MYVDAKCESILIESGFSTYAQADDFAKEPGLYPLLALCKRSTIYLQSTSVLKIRPEGGL
jgi:hypothetical protein